MTDVRKAGSAGRRQALLLILLGALLGSSFLVAFERYRSAIKEWLVSEPAELPHRLQLVLGVAGLALALPLLALAIHFWSIGTRTIRAGHFPPPRVRVVRDTPIIDARSAAVRGRALQVLAVVLAIGAVLIGGALWRLTVILAGHG